MPRRELPKRTGLPIPISERFEFASERWLDSARAFLQEKLDTFDGNTPSGRFAAVETYTNAPPHLKCPNDVATIHIVIENGNLDIGYGEVADPTFHVKGDFNRSLVIGASVYEQLPDRRERIQRELHHRHGNVLELTGSGFADVNPELLKLLAGLHDHLAKRTVGNPDIPHKLKHLDVEDSCSRS